MKNKQMVRYGLNHKVLGRILKFSSENVFRFKPFDSNFSWQNSKEELEIVNEKYLTTELSIEEQDKILMEEHRWLGQPMMVHRIGEYIIVQYEEKDFNTKKLTGKMYYSIEIDNLSCSSLDEALICCILKKNNKNTSFANLILRGIEVQE